MGNVTVKRVWKNFYTITAQNYSQKIKLDFELKLKMKFSARALTEEIMITKSKFASVGIEVYETDIYDEIRKAYGKKLPPLLL